MPDSFLSGFAVDVHSAQTQSGWPAPALVLPRGEVFWGTRAKDNLRCRVVRKLQHGADGNILRDDLIRLTGPARKAYPVELRRVVALVEVDGELREMVFLTNHLEWSAQTIADLYRCRWQIEVFFKQTLQLADFLGNSATAVRWQM